LSYSFDGTSLEEPFRYLRVETIKESSRPAIILRLLGETTVVSRDVVVVVDEDHVDTTIPITSYEEVRRAISLFPEAQLTVALVKKSAIVSYQRRENRP